MRCSKGHISSLAHVILVLLLISAGLCQDARTAYLLGSLQSSNPANHTYKALGEIIQPSDGGVYDKIVLLSNYTNTPGPKLLVSDRNLSITSAPGNTFTFDMNFMTGAITIDNATVVLHDLATYRVRRTTGQAIPFFEGEGLIVFRNVVRFRIGCAEDINTTLTNLLGSPRPQQFPGKQIAGFVNLTINGVQYPHSLHVTDFAYFIGPADVGDFRVYAGYTLFQSNVTRACLSYTPKECLLDSTPDACRSKAIDAYLAEQAPEPSERQQPVAVIAGSVVAGVVLLAATMAGYLVWRRRRRQRRRLSCMQQVVVKQLHEQSYEDQPSICHPSVMLKSSASLIRSGFAGTIEQVALGGYSNDWCMMACHSAPEFKNATPTGQISLGVLLGAGSFGRVYQGRWRGINVAVKVLHHDSASAAAVANEVDLVMSFRHSNIVAAYHFVTWKQSLQVDAKFGLDSPTVDAKSPEQRQYGVTRSSSSGKSAAQQLHGTHQDLQRNQQLSGSDPHTSAAATSCSSEGPIPACHQSSSSTISSSCGPGTGKARGYQFGVEMAELVPHNSDSMQSASPLSGTGALPVGIGSNKAAKQQDVEPSLGSGVLQQPGDRDAGAHNTVQDAAEGAGGQQGTGVNPINLSAHHHQQQKHFLPFMKESAHEQQLVSLPALQETVDTSVPWPHVKSQPRHQQQTALKSSSDTVRQHQSLVPLSMSGSSDSLRGSKNDRTGLEAQTWLILEFCDGGTLLDMIDGGQLISQATGSVEMAHVLTLLSDIATGMLYLHSRNVLHGDLKPGNVMLKKQHGAAYGHKAMITDFGLSRCLKAGQSHRSTRTMGTVNHTPPELLRLGRLSPASDVYAFAIMMWELYAGKVAWAHMHYGEVFERVALRQERPPLSEDMPEPYVALMTSCWSPEPFQRPTFAVIKGRLEAMLAAIVQGEQDAQARFVSDL